MKLPLAVLLAAGLPALLPAQMSIQESGPLNAASYIPHGLPNSGIAQGSIFIVKGTDLCAAGYTKVSQFPVPTSLNGTSIKVAVGASSVDAFMIYTYGGAKDAAGTPFDQIAAMLPSNAPLGTGTMTVSYNNRTATSPIKVLKNGPGIFTLSQSGRGPGVVTDNEKYQANTIVNSFNDKMWANAWVTGLAPLASGQRDDIAPPVGNLNVSFDLFIGGQILDKARIAYYGRAPGNPGLDQIAFQPPPGMRGCAIPILIKVGDFYSNTATISLGDELKCSDPLGPTLEEFERILAGQPLNKADVVLARADINVQGTDSKGVTRMVSGTVDLSYGRVSQYQSAYAPYSQEVTGLPALGTCLVQYGSTKNSTFDEAVGLTSDPVPHSALNAGPSLSIAGPNSTSRTVAAPGAPPASTPCTSPLAVTIKYVNNGSDSAHIFIDVAENFGPLNKLPVGGSRTVTVPYVKGLKINFIGGRNGNSMATGSVTLSDCVSAVTVTFDESPNLKVQTTSGQATGPQGIAMFQTVLSSGYYKLLGAELKNVEIDPEAKIDPLFLGGGNYTLASQKVAGGVGAMNKAIAVPTANRMDWTAKNATNTIVRADGYTATWTGGDPATDVAVIYGHSAGAATGTYAPGVSFTCTANIDDRKFPVPPYVLLQLPASSVTLGGIFAVGTAPKSNMNKFTAEGIESGQFSFVQTAVRSVTYR